MANDKGRNRKSSSARSGGKVGGFFRELGIMVVLVLALTAVLRGFVVGPYMIPSGSMENTLQVGDKILVNKLAYRFGDVKRGDVIVFDGTGSFSPEVRTDKPDDALSKAGNWVKELFGGTPVGEKDFTKRVIGVSGDKVECRKTDSGFAMFVNGARLDEKSYLFPGNAPCDQQFKGKRAVTVPEGRLWVMGDHREMSADSRSHVDDGHFGTVPEDAVIGRAFVVAWPSSHWSTLSRPSTYDQRALQRAGR